MFTCVTFFINDLQNILLSSNLFSAKVNPEDKGFHRIDKLATLKPPLKVGSEEIGSSPCKCSPLLSLTFVEIKKSFT